MIKSQLAVFREIRDMPGLSTEVWHWDDPMKAYLIALNRSRSEWLARHPYPVVVVE